jgi:hypothetical protein
MDEVVVLTFSFRKWQEYLNKHDIFLPRREDKLQEYNNNYYPKQDPSSAFRELSKSIPFGEPELRYFFTIPVYWMGIHHKQIKDSYTQFIKDSYKYRIEKYNINLIARKDSGIWSNEPVSDWTPGDFHYFLNQIPAMQRFLDIVNKNGVTPAIVLLGIRRRSATSLGGKKTLLHSQPTDIIRIIARMVAASGWYFNMRMLGSDFIDLP